MKNLFHNPVLVSELKTRMRGFRAPLAVTVYLGILLTIAFLVFNMLINSMNRYGALFSVQSMGLRVYTLLAYLQFMLIVLITPAQTAGAISGEREKQTLDLLLCTRMSALGIILGKLFSSMGFILLLIVGSIPLFSLVFLFGGIAPGDVAQLFLFYLITAFAIGSIGIFCSTIFKRTVGATVTAYLVVFVLGLVTMVVGAYMTAMHYQQYLASSFLASGHGYVPFVFYLNPAVGLADLLDRQMGGMVGSSPLSGLLLGFSASIPAQSGGWGWSQWSFWIKNAMVILSIALVLIGISTWKITPVKCRFNGKRRGLDEKGH